MRVQSLVGRLWRRSSLRSLRAPVLIRSTGLRWTSSAAPPPSGNGGRPPADSSPVESSNLEVKDAALIFSIAWENLKSKFGEENLIFPRDIMWLSGAPGAGKSLVSQFIKRLRGITSDTIVVSDLLKGGEIEAVKSSGKLVSDRAVVQLLLERLLQPQYSSGVLIDGFPRTRVQAECMKFLFDEMRELGRRFDNTPNFHKYPRPVFHIMVLFVEEEVSIERQLKRGRQVTVQNRLVQTTGVGESMTVRPTDADPKLARARYREFKEHVYNSLQAVKDKFHFHFVDGDGPIEHVQERIQKELEYQSKMELSDDAFQLVRRIPLPREVTVNARYNLIQRLENYVFAHKDLFTRVIQTMEQEFMGIIKRQALLGRAIIRTENPIFLEPLALDICLDLFSERGYIAVVDVQKRLVADRVERGKVIHRTLRVFEFDVSFQRPIVRY